MPGDRGWLETARDAYLPFDQHVTPEVVVLDDGSLMACCAMPGLPFELEAHGTRNARSHRVNSLSQLIADDNVTMHFNFVHGDGVPSHLGGKFQSSTASAIYSSYEGVAFAGGAMENVWLLSIVVHPRIFFEGPVRKLKRRLIRGRIVTINQECEQQLEDIMQIVMVGLTPYNARRLGYRKENGWLYTEIGEALTLILTARWRPVPLSNGPLGDLIYNDPVVFGGWWGRHSFRIDDIDQPRVGMMLSYKHYPSKTRVGMLNDLLGFEAPLVITHSFRFEGRTDAQTRMTMRQIQMQNAGDEAHSLLLELIEMKDEVASSLSVTGSHHVSVAVYADELKVLTRRAARVSSIMGAGGAIGVREARGAMAAYFTQLPGARTRWRCRPGVISSRNLAHFVPLEGYPEGEDEGYWGAPVIRFRTNGGTIYQWHPHVGEVGHTFVCGMSGKGKTTFLSFLLCCLQRTLASTDAMIVLDKDEGMAPTILGCGGSYTLLRRGVPSGSAPLRAYDNTPRNVGHLAALFERLILLDGRGTIDPAESDGLVRGVSRQLKLPARLRSMEAVRAFLPKKNGGAAERFVKWCRGGVYGWLFDNDEDTISVGGFLSGFDFTELLPNEERPDDGCAGAMAADIMFRLRPLMDGRRIAVVADEAKFYIDSIGGLFEDLALTGRKKEMIFCLATQKPSHILDHPRGRSILAQCPTSFLFPDEKVEWRDYGEDGLGCTPAEFRYLKDKLTVAKRRQVMIKRNAGSVVVEFDLAGLDNEIALLSGRTDTAELMRAIVAELGPDATPEDRVAEFNARWPLLDRVARRPKRNALAALEEVA